MHTRLCISGKSPELNFLCSQWCQTKTRNCSYSLYAVFCCNVRWVRISQVQLRWFWSVLGQMVASSISSDLKLKQKFLQLVRNLLFADDCGVFAHTEDHLQILMNHFSSASGNSGHVSTWLQAESRMMPLHVSGESSLRMDNQIAKS